MSLDHPDNFPVGYDRGHKSTCEWPDCPGGTDCEGLSLLSEKTLILSASDEEGET